MRELRYKDGTPIREYHSPLIEELLKEESNSNNNKNINQTKMGTKIEVSIRESYTTFIAREYILIDSEDSEETKGMSKKELIDYIKANYQDGYKREGYNTLEEELYEQEITREKTTDQDVWLAFKDPETGETEEHFEKYY